MTEQRVSIELADNGVAQVRLNRPDKMNALDPEMFAAIIDAGDQIRSMKGLRAVVLSGKAAHSAPVWTSPRSLQPLRERVCR